MADPIGIILITYERTEYALKTVRGIFNVYPEREWLWYVADDGSRAEHYQAVVSEILNHGGHIVGQHSAKMSYGGGCNLAMRAVYQHTNVALFLEDDWELRKPFELDRHLALLKDDSADVGMIRFGALQINQTGETFGHTGLVYWRLGKNRSYCFSGNPSLRNLRFVKAYGDYTPNLAPGDTETAYDCKVRKLEGPSIVYPAYLGEWGAFAHVGTIKSY